MMTSSNENIFRVTGHLCGEFNGPRWIPRTKASVAELCCFLDLRLNKRLSKQSRGWWFETLSRSLWRHRNDNLSCSLLPLYHRQCSPKLLTADTLKLKSDVLFAGSNSDLYSAAFIVLLYIMPLYIKPHHKGARLYMETIYGWRTQMINILNSGLLISSVQVQCHHTTKGICISIYNTITSSRDSDKYPCGTGVNLDFWQKTSTRE